METKKKNKKGLNTIEIVIITLTFIICICGIVDLVKIMQIHNAISTNASYVIRTIGKQGGIRTSKPSNFVGEYTTSASLYNAVKENMNCSGVKDGDWHLYITINGYTKELSSSENYPLADYGEEIKISLSSKYYWSLLSQMTPAKLSGTTTSHRTTQSKFKVRNNTLNTTFG